MLVKKRGELKGLSHKDELARTKEEILRVSKELKTSTRKLMRQLQDNPDVTGNQQLIKKYKMNLVDDMGSLHEEMTDN